VLVGRRKRRHEERVFARLTPAGERQPTRRPQRFTHVRKRQRGIGKEHHAEPRRQHVETCRLERIDGRIREREFDRQILRRRLPRPLQHRTRDIDAEHMPRRRDLSRECDRGSAATAADIDDTLARPEAGAVDNEIGDRLEQHILRRLAIGPALACGTIPVGDLVGVLIVAGGRVHERSWSGRLP